LLSSFLHFDSGHAPTFLFFVLKNLVWRTLCGWQHPKPLHPLDSGPGAPVKIGASNANSNSGPLRGLGQRVRRLCSVVGEVRWEMLPTSKKVPLQQSTSNSARKDTLPPAAPGAAQAKGSGARSQPTRGRLPERIFSRDFCPKPQTTGRWRLRGHPPATVSEELQLVLTECLFSGW